jgi:hypothetical protein
MEQEDLAIELRTGVLLVAFLAGGYFAWERYSSSSAPVAVPSAPFTTPHIDAKAPGSASPSPATQYADVVRYMTADGKFGMTDDQSKVPPGAKILGVEQRESHTEQRNPGAATRPADNGRHERIRSGLALSQLESEQAVQKAQRDAEDASSSYPAASANGSSTCRQSPGSPHAVFCDPAHSRSVDEVSVHP